jgi:hypothetical protein
MGLVFEGGPIRAWAEGGMAWAVDEPTIVLPDGTRPTTRMTAVLRREADGSYRLLHQHYSWAVPDHVGIVSAQAWREQLGLGVIVRREVRRFGSCAQQSTAARRASQSSCRREGDSVPARRVSMLFGKVRTLSSEAAQSTGSPSPGPSGTSVAMPRTVLLTGATRIACRTGIA